jgi:predicted nucleotidyltransferase
VVRGKKHLPSFIKNPFLQKILQSNLAIVITAWIFQSCLYTAGKETVFKLSVTLLITALLMLWFSPVIALVTAHTLNMIFNGHVPAMFTHMGLGNQSKESFMAHVQKIKERLENNSSVSAAYAYGSLSRGMYKSTSDIDIRLIPAKGKWIRCLFVMFRERTYALMHWFPLDIYAFSREQLAFKMRPDEPPICLKPSMEDSPETKTVSFAEFIGHFKKSADNETQE